ARRPSREPSALPGRSASADRRPGQGEEALMARTRFSRPTLVKVIVFAILSAAFTIGLAVKIGNLKLFHPQYSVNAVFQDAAGVFKGDAVKLAGVDVGRVGGTKIEN